MAIGPIPWNHIVTYAQHHKLSHGVTNTFVQVIREMDAGYLASERKAQSKPKPKRRGGEG